MKFTDLTAEQIAEIKRLHATGMPMKPMARHTGISRHFILRVLDPTQYQRKVNRELELAAQRRGDAFHRGYVGRLAVPGSVIAERDRRLSYAPTPNMIVLGDPPPGRSALERRHAP